MAQIGLKYPIAAPIEDYADGVMPEVTKETAFVLGKMISADKDVTYSDNPLYADDGIAENDTSMSEGKITVVVDHMTLEAQSKLYGHTYTQKGEDDQSPEKIVRGAMDVAPYHILGYYKTLIKNNKKIYQTTIIYKVKFKPPKESAKTKEKSITWGTYESEGTIECLQGFENDPYEETAQFDTEKGARDYLEKFFKLNAE